MDILNINCNIEEYIVVINFYKVISLFINIGLCERGRILSMGVEYQKKGRKRDQLAPHSEHLKAQNEQYECIDTR